MTVAVAERPNASACRADSPYGDTQVRILGGYTTFLNPWYRDQAGYLEFEAELAQETIDRGEMVRKG